jgi:hypothetical protein
MLSRRTTVIAVALAVGLTGGCWHHAGPRPAGSPPLSAPADADRKAQAQRDVADRLAAFRPPGDAKRLPGQPPDTPLLADSTWPDIHAYAHAATAVAATSWWQLSGGPQAVVAGLTAPGGASAGGSGRVLSGSETAYGARFSWPRAGVLVVRTLNVLGARVGGATVLRVDAWAVWVPVRPAASLVPASSRALVVSFRSWRDPEPTRDKRYGPVTIIDPAQVAAVVDLVNALPVQPLDPGACPYDGLLDLTFRSATDTDVAHAQLETGRACDATYLEAGPTRTTLAGATELARSVLATLQLPWTVVTPAAGPS